MFYVMFVLYLYRREQKSTTLVVKHYNDLLGSQTSEVGRDEVTFFYVGGLFCIHLGTMAGVI